MAEFIVKSSRNIKVSIKLGVVAVEAKSILWKGI